MSSDRVASLTDNITQDTVLGDLLKPLERALERVRFSDKVFSSIGMVDFITLGVVRHLQGLTTLRECVQVFLHEAQSTQVPVPRSTFSDALASVNRLKILRNLRDPLASQASKVLPDRLIELPGLNQRAVYAMDGTYQKESAHFSKQTPKQGGNDNPKGHLLLSFYDIRLGIPIDVHVSTRSEHELATLRDYDKTSKSLTQEKNAVWLADRAFIDAKFWDMKKQRDKTTMITRMKTSLLYESSEDFTIADLDVNLGVISDQYITLNSSEQTWRLITYRTRRNHSVEFLTNELDLEPGVVAFLYSRRWEEEKCFDTWKNDYAMAKAWGKSINSIESQARMAIITSILVAMLVFNKAGKADSYDEKSINKQLKRQASQTDGTDRPDWSVPIYRFTTKVSRQVLRFINRCLFKLTTPTLYRTQLRPMLTSYL